MRISSKLEDWVVLTDVFAHTLLCGCSACTENVFFTSRVYAAYLRERVQTPELADSFVTMQVESYRKRLLN